MRLVVTAAAALLCATAASAQDRPPAYANAEACLRENAARAVQVSAGATDAAEFLLGYLCAETVGYALAYERNSSLLVGFLALGGSEIFAPDPTEDADISVNTAAASNPFQGFTIDAVTGELRMEGNDEFDVMMPVLSDMMGLQASRGDGRPPVFLRVLAGELVLQHRR